MLFGITRHDALITYKRKNGGQLCCRRYFCLLHSLTSLAPVWGEYYRIGACPYLLGFTIICPLQVVYSKSD